MLAFEDFIVFPSCWLIYLQVGFWVFQNFLEIFLLLAESSIMAYLFANNNKSFWRNYLLPVIFVNMENQQKILIIYILQFKKKGKFQKIYMYIFDFNTWRQLGKWRKFFLPYYLLTFVILFLFIRICNSKPSNSSGK